ncbi:MAG: polyphosphate polymerase domain-containing protein [Clostridia bacterium]|nr:polyphosphate polymerase domain-containing protein [Clostridia bacterium]
MTYQSNFKRYELKYILTARQKEEMVRAMSPYMSLDDYGLTTIRNLYFDTDNYRLVRHSIERPAYKEKLRIRSYKKALMDEMVFVELKKKYKSVVYKRRLAVPQRQALDCLREGTAFENRCQIAGEIEYFRSYYGALCPVVFLSYDREAFYSLDESDFRVTFDRNILCRQHGLTLDRDIGGIPILSGDMALMEIKTSGGIPLWMTRQLTAMRLFKTSFSKYGTAYERIIFPERSLLYA